MVNTFITSNSLEECAKNLDYRRLGKQRVECLEIINSIENPTKGWKNHPVSIMWKDHVDALKLYCNYMINEWIVRKFSNNMVYYFFGEEIFDVNCIFFDIKTKKYEKVPKNSKYTIFFPKWFKWKEFQLSHQASLLRKDYNFYIKKFELNEDFLNSGYIWPGKYPDFYSVDFDFNMCDPIGSGAPIQWRITREETMKWFLNKEVNPKTGKKINKNSKSGMYVNYLKAYEYYSINPEV
jgi:hypothetical protein